MLTDYYYNSPQMNICEGQEKKRNEETEEKKIRLNNEKKAGNVLYCLAIQPLLWFIIMPLPHEVSAAKISLRFTYIIIQSNCSTLNNILSSL